MKRKNILDTDCCTRRCCSEAEREACTCKPFSNPCQRTRNQWCSRCIDLPNNTFIGSLNVIIF